jgi:hypothetical protein
MARTLSRISLLIREGERKCIARAGLQWKTRIALILLGRDFTQSQKKGVSSHHGTQMIPFRVFSPDQKGEL